MKLDRATIERALAATAERLRNAGITGEICIFGGAAMVLAFDARAATRDVDAVFRPPDIVRRFAAEIADEMSLPVDWLNDGVKGFASAVQDYVEDDMPQFPSLRVVRPSAAYLFAMKCMAARVEGYGTTGDKDDAVFLARQLGLKSVEEALGIVARYFPPERLHIKTRFFIEETMQELTQI